MPIRRGMGGLSSGAGGNLFDRPGFFDNAEIVKLTVDTELLLKAASETYGIKITHASTSGNNQDFELQIPALSANAEIVTTTHTQTLSNKTIADLRLPSIFDSNGNELFLFTSTANAVNEITFANAAAGDAPVFSATGGDTNIDITLAPKGSGVVNIVGNINVTGTSTTVNSTTLDVDDKNITMGSVASPSDVTADGGGITLKGATDKTIIWDNAYDNWTSSEHLNLVSGKSFKINNVNVLNATTLGSSVVNSSLESVGTLTNLTVTNAIAGSVTGSAATVTGATQSAITSIGDLGELTVDNININGNTINATSGDLILSAAGNVSFGDDNILNIGTIAVDSVVGDGTALAIGDNSDDDVSIYRVTALTLMNNVDVGNYKVTAKVFEASDLIAGHIVYASTNGLLATDESALEWNDSTNTLTATNIGAYTLSGKLTAGSTEIEGSNFDINGGAIDGVTIGTNAVATDIRVDNLKLDGNTISSTDSDGHVHIAPNGTGNVNIDGDTLRLGDANAQAEITTNGTGNLKLHTNAGTNSGHIQINAGADGTIDITPNGTGEVNISKVDIDAGNIDGTTLGAASAVSISAGSVTGSLTWGAIQNFASYALTNVNIDSGTVNLITSFGIKQAATTYEMQIATGSTTLTANRVVTIDPKNAARALTLGGDINVSGAFTTSGDDAVTLTTTNTTDVTLPTTGTLSTLAGNETLTNKALTTPAISSISNSGTITLPTGTDTLVGRATTDTLTNKTIAGGSNTISAIANSSLTNSAITIGGTATSLGGTITALTALTDLDLTAGNKTIFDTIGDATLTIGASDTTVAIAGDLTVAGTTTTTNTSTLEVDDPLFQLAVNNDSSDTVDIGFYGLYDTSGSQNLYSGLFRDANDSGKWKLFKDLQVAPTTTVNTGGTGYTAGTLVANLEGAVTGNAATATTAAAWTTARTLSFTGDVTGTGSVNGSADVATALTIGANAVHFGMLHNDVINGLGALGSGAVSTGEDYLMVWDETDDTLKKVLVSNLGVSGQATGSSNEIQYNNSNNFAGASNVEIKNNSLALKEQSAPTNVSGYGMVYAGTDNELYFKDEAGNATKITDAGSLAGGGAFRGAKAYLAANVSIPDSVDTKLGNTSSTGTWTEVFDVGGFHNTGSNQERFTFGQVGYYQIQVVQSWAADTAGYRQITVKHVDTSNSNAASSILQDRIDGSSMSNYSGSATVFYADDASDYIEVYAYQNSGSALSAIGGADEQVAITIVRVDVATQATNASGASGRVQISDGSGGFNSDSDLTFSTDTLTATKIGAFEAAGAINFATQAMTNVNIDSGAVDGVTLGTNSAITQAVIDSININGATIGHTSDTDLLTFASGALTVAGTTTSSGNVGIGIGSEVIGTNFAGGTGDYNGSGISTLQIGKTESTATTRSFLLLQGTTDAAVIFGDSGEDANKKKFGLVFQNEVMDIGFIADSAKGINTGTGAMTIDTNSNVGIGTTPAAPLHVSDNYSGTPTDGIDGNVTAIISDTSNWMHLQLLSSTSTGSTIRFGDTDNTDDGVIAYVQSDNSMQFKTNGNTTSRMTIDSSGRVGIGTTSPDYPFEIEASNIDTGGSWLAMINNTATEDNPSGLMVKLNDPDSTGTAFAVYNHDEYEFVINALGNVAIGHDAPSAKLHVIGDVKVDTGVISVADGSASAPSFTNTGDLNTGMYFPAANALSLTTDGTERLRIAPDGHIELSGSDMIQRNATSGILALTGGLHYNDGSGAAITLAGRAHTWNGAISIITPNAAEDAGITRINITGDVDSGASAYTFDGGTLTFNATSTIDFNGTGSITTSAANANIYITPNGTGEIYLRGIVELDQTAGHVLRFNQDIGIPAQSVNRASVGAADYAAGDTRLYIVTEAGNQLILGNGEVRWNSAGTIATGSGDLTLSPSSELNISKNGPVFTRFTDTSDSVTTTVGSDTTYGFIGTTTADEFQLWSGNAAMAKIPADRASFEFQQATTLKTTTGVLTIDGDDDLVLSAGGTERARLDTTNGQLFLGGTANDHHSSLAVFFKSGYSEPALAAGRASNGPIVMYYVGGVGEDDRVAEHHYNGSTMSLQQVSDYRAKENFVAVSDGITRVKAIKPYWFNKKNNPDHTVMGFLAHDVASVVPEAVIGEKDAVDGEGKPVYQTMDATLMLPVLVAAIQELSEQVDSLTKRLENLES